mmetsp:Transcript_9618/g.26963  ORF Transcript_9618/g.26963 Transcript_9618/m.26963 type:complete len:260 (+) Transcript_9618:535-1314(+)
MWSREVARIRLVLISHIHADHHVGLVGILEARLRLGLTDPLCIVGPPSLEHSLEELRAPLGLLYTYYVNLHLLSAASPRPTARPPAPTVVAQESLRKAMDATGIDRVEAVCVPHCFNAFAYVVRTRGGRSVVFSGDTRPSEDLARAGQGADVLLHEATFEHDMVAEARKKMHSTTVEALEVADRMGATDVVLNHFSQRYPKLPVSASASSRRAVMVAFDLMCLPLDKVGAVAQFLPAIRCVLEEEEEEEESKASAPPKE